MSSCPHNMANFGSLTAEIGSGVWGIPSNFNGVCVLAALLHGTCGRQPNFAALNRRRHLYSAGRPSRWALAHILVIIIIFIPKVVEISRVTNKKIKASWNGYVLIPSSAETVSWKWIVLSRCIRTLIRWNEKWPSSALLFPGMVVNLWLGMSLYAPQWLIATWLPPANQPDLLLSKLQTGSVRSTVNFLQLTSFSLCSWDTWANGWRYVHDISHLLCRFCWDEISDHHFCPYRWFSA